MRCSRKGTVICKIIRSTHTLLPRIENVWKSPVLLLRGTVPVSLGDLMLWSLLLPVSRPRLKVEHLGIVHLGTVWRAKSSVLGSRSQVSYPETEL